MSDSPKTSRPRPEDTPYDLPQALASVVALRAIIPADALTAGILGTERTGHGVLIDASGVIVTIGYLIAEAETVWIVANDGQAVPGYVVGYDQETGFGLVQALQKLTLPALPLGDSQALAVGESVIVAGHGGLQDAIKGRVIAKQEFAGYWEYVLDEAIFTAPAHPNWGGAALLGHDGSLRGIGSLMVQEASTTHAGANMIVPIDLLKPIYHDLLRFGRANRTPRPWLGLMATEVKGALVVVGLVDGAPADQADLRVGDLVLEVAGTTVSELADFFRLIWRLGPAGVDVPLQILRNGAVQEIKVRSVNRYDCLKTPHLH